MKTIDEWRKIFGMDYDYDDDGKTTLRAIRNEAFDAAIEKIESWYLPHLGHVPFERIRQAIEELKEKK